MTVTTTSVYVQYDGNGSTTVFTVPFQFFSASHLKVTLISSNGTETVKSLTTHYTVAGGQDSNGIPQTGTVTMLTAPASGEKLRIERVTTKTQSTTYTNNDAFPAQTTEAAFDRARLIDQEVALKVDRALVIPMADYHDGVDPALPAAVANKYIRFNAAADGLTVGNGLDWQGAWASGTAYIEGQVVSNGGSSWVCISDHTAAASTEPGVGGSYTSVWAQVAAKGDTGATGATGANGTNGADGVDSGIRWRFDSATSMADPGTGDLRLNNATLSSVTAIAVSDACAESGNPDVSTFVLTWDDSTNTTQRGYILIKKSGAPQNYAVYSVTGNSTDNAGWTQLAVTHVQSAGSFANGDTLAVAFFRTGDKGASGTGSGDLLSTNNLSDVANAATARANLGLAIGTNVQAYDADLAALAGLASNGIIARTGSGTAATRTITGTAGQISVTNGDGVSGNPTLALDSSVYRSGGTDVALADGGTGASLSDPNADRILFWDDSAGQVTWLEAGSGLSISGTTITATATSSIDRQVFDSSGTWTKPGAGTLAFVQVWGAGGSGSRGSTGSGGGGGGYVEGWFLLSDLGATEAVTVGNGGASVSANSAGNNGGNSSFGSLLTAYGGAGGQTSGGGGGGGPLSAGSGLNPGNPQILSSLIVDFSNSGTISVQLGKGAGSSVNPNGSWNGAEGIHHGGGGGTGSGGALRSAGSSVYGGGGGGGATAAVAGSGGTSIFGGAGGNGGVNGANGTAGAQPGGGGGGCEGTESAVSGAGGAGRVIITVF